MDPSGWFKQQVFDLKKNFPLGATIGTIGTIIGVLGGGAALLDSFGANTTVREWVLSVTLGLVTVIALFVLAMKERQFSRHSKYVATLHQQEKVTEVLRDLRIYLRRFGRGREAPTRDVLAKTRVMAGEILTIYSQIFSSLTGTRCRTCVKLLYMPPSEATETSVDDILVITFARNSISSNEERTHDERRAAEKLDKLKDNSDFVSLFDPEKSDSGFFLSNNLPNERDYETSSWNYRTNIISSRNAPKSSKWPLWYKSTIVWPVRRDRNEELGIENTVCLGFVTVDSELTDVFTSEHVQLGKMLANSFYPILDQYVNLDELVTMQPEEAVAVVTPKLIAAQTGEKR